MISIPFLQPTIAIHEKKHMLLDIFSFYRKYQKMGID